MSILFWITYLYISCSFLWEHCIETSPVGESIAIRQALSVLHWDQPPSSRWDFSGLWISIRCVFLKLMKECFVSFIDILYKKLCMSFFLVGFLVLQEHMCFSHQIEVCPLKKCAENQLCWWHRTIVFCLKSKHWIWEVLWQKVCNMGVDMVKTIQEVLKS